MLGDLEKRARTSHSYCASPVFQMGRIIWLGGTRNPIQIGRTAILLQDSLLTGVEGRDGRCQDRGSEEKVTMDLSYDRQEFKVSQGEYTSQKVLTAPQETPRKECKRHRLRVEMREPKKKRIFSLQLVQETRSS